MFTRKMLALLVLFSLSFQIIFLPSLVLAEDTLPPTDSTTQSDPSPTTTDTGGAGGQQGAPGEQPASSDGATAPAAGENAPPTDTGTAGQDPAPPADNDTASSGPAIIVTGDAVTTSETDSSANQNTTSVENSGGNSGGSDQTISASSTNDGTIDTQSGASATTGANSASSGGGAAIITGNALASANVINVLNTNIVNSNGFIVLMNQLFGGTLDLSAFFSSLATSLVPGGACSLTGCAQNGVEFNSQSSNDATISNAVIVRASTGENSATASGATALIETGDAYAGANIINVANFNAVNSNYLLVGINNFGDLNGDIVLPNASFFSQLLGGSSPVGGLSVENTNAAAVTNTVSASADSGNNTANTTAGAIIETGNATTQVGITNQINTNALGGKKIYLLIRVLGDWSGQVFGLPSGISWSETSNGIEIVNTDAGAGSGKRLDALSVTNTNTAKINNNVSVMALTGENKIDAAQGAISTGNAYAAANVINIANTTIVGENWVFAIFNIMGNWKGNLAFGRPDLWIGGSASGRVLPGATIPMSFTITNRGNADATHVKLRLSSDPKLVAFSTETDASIEWDIGTIPAGKTIEIQREGFVSRNAPGGGTPITLEARVTPLETDADPKDNAERLALVLENGSGGGGGAYVPLTPDSNLQITKTASVAKINAPDSVDYTLHIVNKGGPAYHAQLFDTIRNAKEEIVGQKNWWLGEIKAGEDITITYTAQFSTSTPAGTYTNSAQVKAITRHPSVSPFYGWFGHSNVATSTLLIERNAEPQVEQKDSILSCPPFLTTYLARGQYNNPEEVRKLQFFLKEKAGFESIVASGVFDRTTFESVVAFQNANEESILKPWGVAKGTGFVYYTTRKHINETVCQSQNAETFPLSEEQKVEINTFKSRLEEIQRLRETMPDTSRVGLAPRKFGVAPPTEKPAEKISQPEGGSKTLPSAEAMVGAAANSLMENKKVLKDPFFFDLMQMIRKSLLFSMR
jgi:Domain of unknown function DUF11